MDEFPFLTLTQLIAALQTGEVTPWELTHRHLAHLERFNDRLKAFLLITKERAQIEAEEVFQPGGPSGLLQGIPYAVKDLFDVEGVPTTAGSRLLSTNIALKDSAAVQRFSKAGMILLGKTHTVQFAFSGVGINHDQGTPLNPWMSSPYVPGGSSSGSAVAVASGMVPVALGTDTGGSVRIPAALCGVVGLKTTVGRISRSGVYPLSWTLDSIGVLTRTVEDAALAYRILQGSDPADPVTLNVPFPDKLNRLKAGLQGLRLAFGETVFFDEVDPEVAQAVRETAPVFQSLGARVSRMELPEVAEAQASPKRALMIAAEACVTNERLLNEHLKELDPVVAERMIAGRTLSAPEYLMELHRWKDLRRRIMHTLKDIDALLVPTAMIPAKPLNEVEASAEAYRRFNAKYLRNTSLGNILNLCAVSLPCGFTREGLPIGLMIYAKPFQEELALQIAYAYEQATPWHTYHPPL
jgi:aspartyl-tRNA(Asn)/glutamyl-tRNA(Gln) amidotransferase subunit A